MKAFQGLMQDPLSVKLFDMYKYECSRSIPFNDAVYHANVHVVLHEDHCFRLQSQPDGLLSIQMLDPDKTEVPASESIHGCLVQVHVLHTRSKHAVVLLHPENASANMTDSCLVATVQSHMWSVQALWSQCLQSTSAT